MTPIQLIQALERRKAALLREIETVDEVIAALAQTRAEVLKNIESVMESDFSHGWRALKRYLS